MENATVRLDLSTVRAYAYPNQELATIAARNVWGKELKLRLEELCVECVASSNGTLDELGGQVASLRPLVGSLVLL